MIVIINSSLINTVNLLNHYKNSHFNIIIKYELEEICSRTYQEYYKNIIKKYLIFTLTSNNRFQLQYFPKGQEIEKLRVRVMPCQMLTLTPLIKYIQIVEFTKMKFLKSD